MAYHFTLRRVLGRASSYRALGLALAGFGVILATSICARAERHAAEHAGGRRRQLYQASGPTNLDLGAVLSTGTGTPPASPPRRAPRLITRRH